MVNIKLLKTRNRVIPASLISQLSLITMLAIFLTGCNGNQPTNPMADANLDGEIHVLDSMLDKKFQDADSDVIKLVRRATARYHSTTQAIKAGYESKGPCVEVQALGGGMGYHWVNESLVDADYDPANPEALLYEPDKNGNLKLVGVEYIVLDDEGQEHPRFGDHKFDVGGVPDLMEDEIPHWSLHVWLYKDNPNGTFEPFNPKVTCNN